MSAPPVDLTNVAEDDDSRIQRIVRDEMTKDSDDDKINKTKKRRRLLVQTHSHTHAVSKQ